MASGRLGLVNKADSLSRVAPQNNFRGRLGWPRAGIAHWGPGWTHERPASTSAWQEDAYRCTEGHIGGGREALQAEVGAEAWLLRSCQGFASWRVRGCRQEVAFIHIHATNISSLALSQALRSALGSQPGEWKVSGFDKLSCAKQGPRGFGHFDG